MSQVKIVYGQALYGLCKEEGITETVYGQLEVLAKSFAEAPDFLRLLSAPNIPLQERCQIIDSCFREMVHIYVLNFLKILTEKGIIRSFDGCVGAFNALYDQDHNILPVTAVTAVPLSETQCEKLTQKLAAITGRTPRLVNRVDPECIGGVRLDYDGKRVDGSVATRLATVRDMLKNTVL